MDLDPAGPPIVFFTFLGLKFTTDTAYCLVLLGQIGLCVLAFKVAVDRGREDGR